MKLSLKEFSLKLQHPFTLSRETHTEQQTLVVKLEQDGLIGLGEATSNPYYGITVDIMKNDILKVKTIIESTNNLKPTDFWNALFPYFKTNMFALCALDMAYNDLYTKQHKLKLYEYWNLDISNNPITDFTIGIDTIPFMIKKLKEMPWPIYKIKLGTKEDIAIIKALRKETDAVFRIDANCGWTVDETLKNAIELKKLGVEFIEQPMPANNWDAHKEVYKKSVLPIIADESCQIESDVEKCHNHFHGVNVKLVKCGGLTPAKRMLENAKSLGLQTMVGCMTESSIGISAIAHLLPLLNYVDMDGALLLKEDVANGVQIIDGKTSYVDTFGIGATLK